MRTALAIVPETTRRVAITGGSGRRGDLAAHGRKGIAWVIALIVAGIHAAGIVSQILLLLDVSIQVAARVDDLEPCYAAGYRELRIFPFVMVVRRIEQLHRQIGKRLAGAVVAFLPEDPIRIHVLIGLG